MAETTTRYYSLVAHYTAIAILCQILIVWSLGSHKLTYKYLLDWILVSFRRIYILSQICSRKGVKIYLYARTVCAKYY